jgi:serine/threonine-protein kinase
MSAALEIGECVGPYRIIEPLGGGGMGLVYRAVHALLHRPAAIKVLHPELGAHAIAAGRFLTEARATTAIRHPGIVEVFDYGHTASGRAYIAMELLQGATLGARLERGPLTLVEAMTLS